MGQACGAAQVIETPDVWGEHNSKGGEGSSFIWNGRAAPRVSSGVEIATWWVCRKRTSRSATGPISLPAMMAEDSDIPRGPCRRKDVWARGCLRPEGAWLRRGQVRGPRPHCGRCHRLCQRISPFGFLRCDFPP